MPWTSADVDAHKKGLTPRQKRQWVAVANSALSRCQDAGESDCDGRAIRQANSVVSKEVDTSALTFVLAATIAKAVDSQRRLWGYASIAVMKNGQPLLDLQGDVIEIADLAEGWYGYVKESGELNVRHQGPPVRAHLIEAMVFTPEKLDVLGLPPDALPLAAWVGYEFEDDGEYQQVRDSGCFMFSIEGEAVREPF